MSVVGDIGSFAQAVRCGELPCAEFHRQWLASDLQSRRSLHRPLRGTLPEFDNSPNISSFDGVDSDSLDSGDVSPLHPVQIRGRDNRSVGDVSGGEYSVTDDEECNDTEYSSNNSANYQPLQFSFVTKARPAMSSRLGGTAYSVNKEEESHESSSESEGSLAVDVWCVRGFSAQNYRKQGGFEVVDVGVEIPDDEMLEVPLSSTFVRDLVDRAGDPTRELALEECEIGDWDDPDFEDQLRIMKRVTAYTEAKETILKSAGRDDMHGLGFASRGVKESIDKTSEVKISTAATDCDEALRPLMRANNAMIRGTPSVTLNELIESSRVIVSKANDNLLHNMYRHINAKESTVVLPCLRLTEGSVRLLSPRERNCMVVREATMMEVSKPVRRQRITRNYASQLVDMIFDEHAEEIVEEVSGTHCDMGSAATPCTNTSQQDEKYFRKKHRKHRLNRKVSTVANTVEAKLDPLRVPLSQTTGHEDKNSFSSKRRRARKGSDCSITFVRLEIDEGHEIPEAAEDTCINPLSSAKRSTKCPKAYAYRRPRRSERGRTSTSFSLLEIPDGQVVETREEYDSKTKIDAGMNSRKGYRRASKHAERIGVPHHPVNIRGNNYGATSDTAGHAVLRKKKHRSGGLRGSRQLEFSFVPEELTSEIIEKDCESELGEGRTLLTVKARQVKGGCRKSGGCAPMKRSTPSVLPDISSAYCGRYRVKPRRVAAQLINVTKVPEVVGDELLDTVLGV